MQDGYKHVFGPVPSRRLGRSLGVDLVPYKTCTYDCVYCQIGRTTGRTSRRAEFVPLEEVVAEIERKLEAGAAPDYITLSGSGEPTLYSRLGELIGAVKAVTDVPVAVITNGSLLSDPHVREGLLQADLVVPSLDAADPAAFARVNRPESGIAFKEMVEGLVAFRDIFPKTIWLEILFVAGLNDSEEQVRSLAALAERIRPDRIQLNTVVRPPADADAQPVPREALERFREYFGERAEVIADYGSIRSRPEFAAAREDILAMLQRRPCSLDDVAQGLSISRNEAVKHVEELLAQGLIAPEVRGATTYYTAGVVRDE